MAMIYLPQPVGSESERDPIFDRPIFIISPPRSGSSLLFETLAKSPDLFTIGGESHQLIETIPSLGIADREFSSNRLTEEDATKSITKELRRRFMQTVHDRNGCRPDKVPFRLLEKTPKNALRIPFLLKVFPEARFIFLHRKPEETLSSMIEAWLSGRFRTYQPLPGWSLPYWSLLLIPGWRGLVGKPLPEIVAAQWETTVRMMLNDLEDIDESRLIAVRYHDFINQPKNTVERLCDFLELCWDVSLPQNLPLSSHTLTHPQADKWKSRSTIIKSLMEKLSESSQRSEEVAKRFQLK